EQAPRPQQAVCLGPFLKCRNRDVMVAVRTVHRAEKWIGSPRREKARVGALGGEAHGVGRLVTGRARPPVGSQGFEERPVLVHPAAGCAVGLGCPARVREKYAVGNERKESAREVLLSTRSLKRDKNSPCGQGSDDDPALVSPHLGDGTP